MPEIECSTKHPMKRLLHLAGRAWSFIAANIEGEHFAIRHGQQVTGFLRRAEALPLVDLPEEGRLSYVIKDIESCYPRMPEAAIGVQLVIHCGRRWVFLERR